MAKRKDFDIEIREELSRTVTVKAETLGDAINQVMDQYKRGEIVLDAEDFVGKTIDAAPTAEYKIDGGRLNEQKRKYRKEHGISNQGIAEGMGCFKGNKAQSNDICKGCKKGSYQGTTADCGYGRDAS